jgi:hypothetical protein
LSKAKMFWRRISHLYWPKKKWATKIQRKDRRESENTNWKRNKCSSRMRNTDKATKQYDSYRKGSNQTLYVTIFKRSSFSVLILTVLESE